ncbi:hypothetical protein CK203_036719 [Vitis vinifera]|uniref:Uncharacterized protein n=1 Tax=Vitis vinifera TaxID=29760 RepID=A0A438I0R1_VITVI|nr:hypothetical protein CK203_036719 [Vitis vinifera]
MQDLSYVDFSYACLKSVFFSRANLQCAKFRKHGNLEKLYPELLELNMTNEWMWMLRVPFFIMHLCVSKPLNRELLDFYFDLFGRCEFTGANLRGALLAGANLQSANLQGNFFSYHSHNTQ